MAPDLVIFDCDGVLVDSEHASARVLAEAMAEIGVPMPAEEVARRYRALALDVVEADVARRRGGPLPDGWIEAFRERRTAAFARDGIPAVPGARAVVEAVARAGIDFCVASQGRLDKTRLTLALSGLADLFPDAVRFSADQVPRPKPAPDLFLHAARTLGHRSARCVVIEDSVPGVTAAHAAGMRVLAYAADGDPEQLRAAGGEPFTAMDALPGLLGLSGSRRGSAS